MRKILLLLAAICFSFISHAQISGGLTNNFEDGTTQGWSNVAQSPNPPTNIPTGGPGGVDDNFLEEISAGGGGAGSKMIIQNDNKSIYYQVNLKEVQTSKNLLLEMNLIHI